MTINEIAKLAGVSASTVSKIMNNKDSSISAETREHVLQIAKEYHYKPYASVNTAGTVKTLCIGAVFRNTVELGMSAGGILEAARSEGYSVLFYESVLSPEQELKNITSLINMNVDGIIWEPISRDSMEEAAVYLKRAEIPYLLTNIDADQALNLDYQKMGYLATEALVNANHTDIACLLREGMRTNGFYQGYRQCLFEHNIPVNDNLIFHEEDDFPVSKMANHLFSGIVVSHYTSAVRLYQLADSLHYNIPYDLSLVSLKDGDRLNLEYPPLSTLTIPHFEFSRYLVQTLIHTLEKKKEVPSPELPLNLDNTFSIDIPYNTRLKKILSLGSINIDNYMNFKELPHTGKTVTAPASVIHPGGKCINEAIGAAKLGHNVCAIGCVGDDADANLLYEYAKGCQVDTIGIKRSKGQKTGQAYIFVQEDGDSMITIMSGANNSITPQDIINNERLFTNASFCMMQTEIPMEAVIKAAELAKKHGLTTVLKPSACTFLPTKLLKLIDILVPNLDELNEICPGSDSMEEKTSFLLSKGIQTVIVTLGSKGCYIRSQEFSCSLPAIDVISVDSSGAGDAFISTLVSYLLYDYDLISAAKIATYAAGLSTTRQGTTTALVDRYTLEPYIRRMEAHLLK